MLEVVAMRAERPRLGPKKPRAVLLRRSPDAEVPGVRSVARIVERAALIERHRRPPRRSSRR